MDLDRIYLLAAKKLAGEASADELTELEMILRLNPDLHYSLEALYEIWEKHPETPADITASAYEKHVLRMKEQIPDFIYHENLSSDPELIFFKPKSKKRLLVSAFAVVSLIIGLYWMTRPAKREPVQADIRENKSGEIVTQYGTRTKLLLPDGTTVWLNAGSRLHYDSSYGNTIREVSLTGEGFFDVIKNKDKPFLIHTGNINIRVLGTAFNVKSYPGEKTIETSLIRGKIEVTFQDRPLEKLILKPNQKLILNNYPSDVSDKQASRSPSVIKPEIRILHLNHYGADSLVSETAWIENKLIFQDESFADLAKKMERWYGVQIKIENETLDTIHFTGSFEKENIQQALKALQLFTEFNYTINNGQVLIQKIN